MKIKAPLFTSLFSLGLILNSIPHSEACTRALYTSESGIVMTGRSMDWMEDMHSNMWVFPRGIKRDGAAGEESIRWISKYGSLIVSGYDVGTADGLNEKGLAANVLYLAESSYEESGNHKPLLSISLWAQYALDLFASVSEAVDALRKEPFRLIAPVLPNGSPAQLHLSLSDSSGDSAIFEYLDGKLVIHHGKKYTVMTNSPSYDQQLALNTYWEEIGGLNFLPGTSRAADRFARTYFFLNALPKTVDPHYITAVPGKEFTYQAVAGVLGVIRNVSVPLGISTPDQPNIASTLWRVIADQTNKVYYFDSATTPNTFWIPLADLNFSNGAPVMKLSISKGNIYSGNAAKFLEKSNPFAFLKAHP